MLSGSAVPFHSMTMVQSPLVKIEGITFWPIRGQVVGAAGALAAF